jgi:hypothetical protein
VGLFIMFAPYGPSWYRYHIGAKKFGVLNFKIQSSAVRWIDA